MYEILLFYDFVSFVVFRSGANRERKDEIDREEADD